jgi:hypothetical protein
MVSPQLYNMHRVQALPPGQQQHAFSLMQEFELCNLNWFSQVNELLLLLLLLLLLCSGAHLVPAV